MLTLADKLARPEYRTQSMPGVRFLTESAHIVTGILALNDAHAAALTTIRDNCIMLYEEHVSPAAVARYLIGRAKVHTVMARMAGDPDDARQYRAAMTACTGAADIIHNRKGGS